MNDKNVSSFCGIDCAKCKNYKQNMNCAGCRDETILLADCPTRVCAAQRKLTHCGECNEFPCEDMNRFYNDGNPSHMQAYLNVLEIVKKK